MYVEVIMKNGETKQFENLERVLPWEFGYVRFIQKNGDWHFGYTEIHKDDIETLTIDGEIKNL